MEILLICWSDISLNTRGVLATLIVTTIALIVTIYFSWQNRKMLIESRKARLVFSIISQNRNLYLKVKNVGLNLAHSIQFEMNDKFINCTLWKEQYEDVKNNPFRLSGGDERSFFILPLKSDSLRLSNGKSINSEELSKMIEQFNSIEIIIKGQFIDAIYKKTIAIEEKFYTKEYMPLSAEIPDPILQVLKDIKKQMK